MNNLAPARVALLCILTIALNGNWIIEQPRSSLLLRHHRMNQLHDLFKVGILIFRTQSYAIICGSTYGVNQREPFLSHEISYSSFYLRNTELQHVFISKGPRIYLLHSKLEKFIQSLLNIYLTT